jgi:hypothetical protein
MTSLAPTQNNPIPRPTLALTPIKVQYTTHPVMNRGAGLPAGLANLGDTVRVFDVDGTDLGPMIVAKAQKLASDQGAELFVTERTATPPVIRIVNVRKLSDLFKKEFGGDH